MGLPDIKDVKLYEPGKVYLYKGDWKSPVVKLDLTDTYSRLKKEMESMMAEVNNTLFNRLKESFPQLEDIIIYDKTEDNNRIFRITYAGMKYDLFLPIDIDPRYDKAENFYHDKITDFINKNILRKKEKKPKKTTISKKQRELKKEWML